MKKIISNVLIITLCAGIILAGINHRRVQKEEEEALKQVKIQTQVATGKDSWKLKDKRYMIKEDMKRDFIEGLGKNSVGWISIPGTSIEYPIVQGSDNEYYLHYNDRNQRDAKGAIFLDYRNDIRGNEQLIVYGHRNKRGLMFDELKNYTNGKNRQEFFNEHRYVVIDDFEERRKWKIVSVYVVDLDSEYIYFYPDFKDDSERQFFESRMYNRSIVDASKEAFDDNVLTLVTCSYWHEDARIIIHALPEDE